MPSILKYSWVSTFSGAEPQIKAFKLAPIIFLRMVGKIIALAKASQAGSENRAWPSRSRIQAALARP